MKHSVDQAWEMMGQLPAVQPSPRFEAKVWAGIEARRSRGTAWWQRWLWTLPQGSAQPWAAAALAGLVMGLVAGQLTAPQPPSRAFTMAPLAAFAALPPHSIGAVFLQGGGHP